MRIEQGQYFVTGACIALVCEGNGSAHCGAVSPELSCVRLKGVSICFNILKSALCGNYINFGVLRLYGDAALDNALEVFIKLLLSLPLKNLMVCMACCGCA